MLAKRPQFSTLDQMGFAVDAGGDNFTASFVNSSGVEEDELYEVPSQIVVLLSLCYGAVSAIGVSGNLCLLWIIVRRRRMHCVTNFFIANMACADIIIGLFAIPFQFQAALLQKWVLPWFMCPFCPFVQIVSFNVSTSTMTAIAIDRYRAVMKPLVVRSTKLRAKFIICSIWLFAIAVGMPYLFALRVSLIFDTTTGKQTKPFCMNTGIPTHFWRNYNHLVVSLQYFIPLMVISYVYTRIGLKLKSAKTPGNSQCERDATILKNKKKVIKMLCVVVALFALCWLPFQTYNIVQEIKPSINKFINVIWFSCHWLAMSNSCYNVFIYATYNERFKKEFKKLCPSIRKEHGNVKSEETVTNQTKDL